MWLVTWINCLNAVKLSLWEVQTLRLMNVFVYTSVAQCHSDLCSQLSRGARRPEASLHKKYEETRHETKRQSHMEKSEKREEKRREEERREKERRRKGHRLKRAKWKGSLVWLDEEWIVHCCKILAYSESSCPSLRNEFTHGLSGVKVDSNKSLKMQLTKRRREKEEISARCAQVHAPSLTFSSSYGHIFLRSSRAQ